MVVVVVGVGTAAEMGCISSKQAVSVTPAALDHSGAFRAGNSGWVERVQWSEEE